jgi:molybdopterin-containing oxidoreductase family iron-sulfur binding subunit
MEQKKYWQSFGELNASNAYQSAAEDEFQEELPVEADDKGFLDAKTPRRDFLKYLGFSTAAAAVAASCEMPVRKAIPFVNKPEDVIPGVANFYATTFVQDGEVVPALAKVRDGRPIKMEGNELSPVTLGATSPRLQAAVLDLYDTSRLPFPVQNGKEVSTFDALDKLVTTDLAGVAGRPVVLLTSSITSPTSRLVIDQFLAKFPGSRHVMYDAVSYSGMLLANQATYGRRAIPSYNLAAAKVIVGINADFLSSWLNPVEFNRQYGYGRKLNKKKPDMSRHIQFESMMSMTGANADERYHHRPSESGAIAIALYAALGGAATAPALEPRLQQAIQKTAATLTKSRGAAVVMAGSNDPNVQIIVNGINELIGANGTTIDWSSTFNTHQAIDADFETLVNDMNAGAVGALIIHEANPAYNYHDGKRLVEALKKVKVTISFNQKMDETSELCKYVIPSHHFLESWGDAEGRTGFVSLIQPTINPLFKTRHWQDNLLKWSGSPVDYTTFHRQYWVGRLGSESNWDKALQDGLIRGGSSVNTVLTTRTSNAPDTTRSVGVPTLEDLARTVGGTSAGFNGGAVGGAIAAIGAAKKGGNTELVLYQKVTLGSGQQANNPWLHEAPDPITKATWDNYAVISPALAKNLFKIDIEDRGQTDDYEVHPEKPVLRVTANGKNIELPIIIVPGTNPNTIGIALGYGRGTDAATTDDDADNRKDAIQRAHTHIGRAGGAVGKNAFPLVSFNNVTRDYFITAVDVKDAGYKYKVAQSQTHQTYEGRTEVVLETTLATLRKEPVMFSERREELHKDYAPKEGQTFERDATLYPMFDKPGIKWGMSIDLNSCTGCQACVVACIAENNIAVVGKEEVARFHDMHWLRIDRYFSGSLDNPSVVFQPMLCQHCDNAPCENVCPVAATPHSSEGLNMMAYNRCVGTRYCANNCPYKVRRFNWSDYMGADSFPDNQVGIISDTSMMMNDDLTRMVLNPDVTVRSRGVMEKCSFCVQRLQDGKLKAKKESRPLKTGENGEYDVKTACQQACPTSAIVFGNVNDHNSEVYQHRVDHDDRLFYSLEMLHTLPNVSYLAKVRNNDAIVHLRGEETQETIGGTEGKKVEQQEGQH